MKIDGHAVRFDHLAPITRKVLLELTGGHTKTVDVVFWFSRHCYSRGLAAGELAPAGHEVHDGSKVKPRPRVLDRERYLLSLRLVALIDQLIETNALVTKTARNERETFYRVDQVEVQRDATKKIVSYFVFFHARKVQEPGRPKSLKVFIESAYAEQDGLPHPQGRGRHTLGAMLGKAWSRSG